jgi:hypothetical protein
LLTPPPINPPILAAFIPLLVPPATVLVLEAQLPCPPPTVPNPRAVLPLPPEIVE